MTVCNMQMRFWRISFANWFYSATFMLRALRQHNRFGSKRFILCSGCVVELGDELRNGGAITRNIFPRISRERRAWNQTPYGRHLRISRETRVGRKNVLWLDQEIPRRAASLVRAFRPLLRPTEKGTESLMLICSFTLHFLSSKNI